MFMIRVDYCNTVEYSTQFPNLAKKRKIVAAKFVCFTSGSLLSPQVNLLKGYVLLEG